MRRARAWSFVVCLRIPIPPNICPPLSIAIAIDLQYRSSVTGSISNLTRQDIHTATMAAAAPAFPPGGTYFDGRKSFADVTIDASKDNSIKTLEFLDAAESLTTLFDVLGSAAFKPVKNDMQGNIKVR